MQVPGATGYIDTDYEGKRDAALAQLKSGRDFVYIHVEAPDECGHRGEAANKVKAIEDIDRRILAPLLAEMRGVDEYAILVRRTTPPPEHPGPTAPTRCPICCTGAAVPKQAAWTVLRRRPRRKPGYSWTGGTP